jgi:hypothetical protein
VLYHDPLVDVVRENPPVVVRASVVVEVEPLEADQTMKLDPLL